MAAEHFKTAIQEQPFICNICPCSNSTLLGLKVFSRPFLFVFMSIASVFFFRYKLWVKEPVAMLFLYEVFN